MALQAFLQVGLSFADVGLFKNEKLLAHQRLYLPKEPLGNSLKKFWAEHGTPSSLKVGSRFLEKILEAKLGGTVAQVVTSGFETWPVLRQPTYPDRFVTHPYRQEALASKDLIFGLSERVSHSGQILRALEISELEFINSKLKLMNVKRVCVNLLFSHCNPTHQKQVAQYFLEQGYEVFADERAQDSMDEMPAWRKNVINACLSGAFTEHFEEIQKSFADTAVPIHFFDHFGQEFSSDKNKISGSLFAWTNAFAESLKSEADQILYFGLESWSIISTQARSPYWDSPWGLIECSIPQVQKLKMQPTLEITQGFWGGIHFSKNDLGFEPGPMCFGRALKPTVFDVLNQNYPSDLPQIHESGSKKFRDQLTALIKNIRELENSNVDKLLQNLTAHLIKLIATECQFKSNTSIKKTIVTGVFAPYFQPLLNKYWSGSELILDPGAKTRDVCSLSSFKGSKS